MRSVRAARLPLALVAIGLAVFVPIVLIGYRNIHLAKIAADGGRDADAARLYESAARQVPWRPDLWERAGMSAYSAGDHAMTIQLLGHARSQGTLSASGWVAMGSSYWATDDHAAAISAWKSGSEQNPGDATLLDRLAAAYDSKEDYAAEEEALTRRLAIGDDAASHYRLGVVLMLSDLNRARAELDAAAAGNADFAPAATSLQAAIRGATLETDRARSLVLLGRGLGIVEEWGLAQREFESAVDADAQSAEAWAWLGEAKQHNGQDGASDLERALTLGAQNSLVHVLRGLYLRRQGKEAQALTEYSSAAELDPQNPALQSLLGDAYTASGDLVSALAAYQRATTLAPKDATYWRLLAMFCADNGVQPLEVGLPAAQKAAELDPKDPQVLDALGWSYAQAGYLFKAEETLKQVLTDSPNLALAHLHLAKTYLAMAKSDLALDELKRVITIDGNGAVGQAASRLLNRYFP